MVNIGARTKVQAGPPKEWVAATFMRMEAPLLAYTQRQVGCRELAGDIVQEAFVKLCEQSWPAISQNATAWLYKTCRNRIIDTHRREGRMTTLHSGEDVSQVRDRSQSAPQENLEQDEKMVAVRSQIQSLPPRQQEVLRLRLQEDLSYKQIAEVLGLSVSNVGYLLHQAVTGLRQKLRIEAGE